MDCELWRASGRACSHRCAGPGRPAVGLRSLRRRPDTSPANRADRMLGPGDRFLAAGPHVGAGRRRDRGYRTGRRVAGGSRAGARYACLRLGHRLRIGLPGDVHRPGTYDRRCPLCRSDRPARNVSLRGGRADGWQVAGSGGCQLMAVPPSGYTTGTWSLDPSVAYSATATELSIDVSELACSSGTSPEGRIVTSVDYGQTSVAVTVFVRSLSGAQTCQLTISATLSLPMSSTSTSL